MLLLLELLFEGHELINLAFAEASLSYVLECYIEELSILIVESLSCYLYTE